MEKTLRHYFILLHRLDSLLRAQREAGLHSWQLAVINQVLTHYGFEADGAASVFEKYDGNGDGLRTVG